MSVILCASKYHILSHWTQNIDETVTVAKSQKELLELSAKEHAQAPVILLEDRLYGAEMGKIVSAIREANPAAGIMVLSPNPTFHGGQEALASGVNGFGNVYLAKGWLQDALEALAQGENWIFPLQEKIQGLGKVVGEVATLEGKLFGDGGRVLDVGGPVYAQETLMLTQSTTRATFQFTQGVSLSLKGAECLFVDESVFSLTPHSPLRRTREIPQIKPTFSTLFERPFYVNVGKESLVDPRSSELAMSDTPSQYVAMYPVYVEEVAPSVEESGLTFGACDIRAKEASVISLVGRIEEYEILYPKSLQETVFVNDLVPDRDGARVVYRPITGLAFANATIELFHTPASGAGLKTKQFGAFLDWIEPAQGALKGASIMLWGYEQGVDYLLFERACIPSEVRFSYEMDEAHIGIHFFGDASVKAYRALLGSVRHEASSISRGSLHVKVEAYGVKTSWVLFEGAIDT